MAIFTGKKIINGKKYNTYLARKCTHCGETIYLDRKPTKKGNTVCPKCGQRKMRLIHEVG